MGSSFSSETGSGHLPSRADQPGAAHRGGGWRLALAVVASIGMLSFGVGVAVGQLTIAAWQARRDPSAAREDLERQTVRYMATMPAWRDHPRVAQTAAEGGAPTAVRR